jgi:hypothetical protein
MKLLAILAGGSSPSVTGGLSREMLISGWRLDHDLRDVGSMINGVVEFGVAVT